MLDTIHGTIDGIPLSAPRVAGYVTGSASVRWTGDDWARFPHAGHVRIDQAAGLGVPLESDCADVEDDCKSVDAALAWLRARSSHHWWSLVYVGSPALLTSMRSAVETAHLAKVQYWLCDDSLDQAEAEKLIDQVDGGVVAVQWASPKSNPDTIVPGSNRTLKEANVDLSVTADEWFLGPK